MNRVGFRVFFGAALCAVLIVFLYRLLVTGAIEQNAQHPFQKVVDSFCQPASRAARLVNRLRSSTVQADLQLSDGARGKIERILTSYQQQVDELWGQWREENPDQTFVSPFAADGLLELSLDVDRQLTQVLNVPQRRRLVELTRQVSGWRFVFENDASSALQLTGRQRQKIMDLLVEETLLDSRFRRALMDATDDERDSVIRKQTADTQLLQKEYLDVLTLEQRRIRRKLLGEPLRVAPSGVGS